MAEYLGTKEVAAWIGVPEETLRYWRKNGRGPQSFQMGGRLVKYDRADVQKWIDEQKAASLSGVA